MQHLYRYNSSVLHKAHHLLKLFCLRRVKSEVEVSLPPRTETRVHCPLTPMQTFWYKRLLLKDSSLLLKLERGGALQVESS
jgi:SWI/SNF-related matrix-associated actin-dependent regulator of chromatin subfamily A member 5